MKKIIELLKTQLSLIKEEPVRAFALLYPYILVIGLGFGLFYLSNLNTITRQNIPTVLPDNSVIKDLIIVKGKTIPPVDIFSISSPSNQILSKGKSLYTSNCIGCHGESGKGDGAAAVGMNPPPRNFSDKDGWKNGTKISQMYKTLEEGIAGSSMIPYNFLLPEDRLAIIQYVRTSIISGAPHDSKDELTALDKTYNLSQGVRTPAQIPVEAAIELVANENEQKIQNLNQLLLKISEDKTEKGAEIFKSITFDKIRTLTLLSSSDEWHQNLTKFVSLVVGNISSGGFSSNVNKLSQEEWITLYNYLRMQI